MQPWYRKASVQSSIWGGFFVLCAAIVAPLVTHKLETRDNKIALLEQRLASYEFSAPLFESIPNDLDFLVRDLRVDKNSNSTITIFGPVADDQFTIQTSILHQIGTDDREDPVYGVQFRVYGNLSSNRLMGGGSNAVPVKPGASSGPINAGQYDFYLVIEKVEIDYIYLAVARRRLSNIKVRNSRIPFGGFRFNQAPPQPVLTKVTGD